MNVKPDSVVAMAAMASVTSPTPRPATKKSRAVRVRRALYTPMAATAAKYSTATAIASVRSVAIGTGSKRPGVSPGQQH